MPPVSKDSSLRFIPDLGALTSCMHTVPKIDAGLTMI